MEAARVCVGRRVVYLVGLGILRCTIGDVLHAIRELVEFDEAESAGLDVALIRLWRYIVGEKEGVDTKMKTVEFFTLP